MTSASRQQRAPASASRKSSAKASSKNSSPSATTRHGWPPLYASPVTDAEIKRGDGEKLCETIEALCTVSKDGIAARGGDALILREWQRQLLYRLFARRADGRLRHRIALIGLPRKNGKSSIGSALALDGLIFGGMGAEVYSAAAEKEQARIVFGETKRMIQANEELSDACNTMRDVIEVSATNSIYRVLSAEAYSKEGLNITRAIVDELHAHPNDDLWNVLNLATGARIDPLVIAITTAGVMSDSTGRDSVCYRLFKHGVDVAGGVVDDPSFFFAWWGAPDGADHTDPEVWAAANPGYGDLIDPDDFLSSVARTPENEFRTKRLNQWVSSTEAWLPSGAWDALADPDRTVASDTRVVLGFDGSRSRDATAIVGVTVEERPHVFVVDVWERPIDAPPDWQVPVGDVKQSIRSACQDMNVTEIAVDASLWQTELEELANEGLPVVQHPQRATMMVPATQRFYEAVTSSGLTHDGDPRLARHMRNAIIRYTSSGPQLYKESKGSPRKIDAAIAAVMAFHRTFEVESQQYGHVWFASDFTATQSPTEKPEVEQHETGQKIRILEQSDVTVLRTSPEYWRLKEQGLVS